MTDQSAAPLRRRLPPNDGRPTSPKNVSPSATCSGSESTASFSAPTPPKPFQASACDPSIDSATHELGTMRGVTPPSQPSAAQVLPKSGPDLQFVRITT